MLSQYNNAAMKQHCRRNRKTEYLKDLEEDDLQCTRHHPKCTKEENRAAWREEEKMKNVEDRKDGRM